MSYDIVRDEKEIEELKAQCEEQEAEGRSKFFGMTYEQGILAVLAWLADLDEEDPMGD